MGFRRAKPFAAQRGRRGAVAVALSEPERMVLADLLDDVAGLLDPEPPDDADTGATTSDDAWRALEAALRVEPPADPAVARLLPAGNRDDEELAQGFRRLTEQSLREHKQSGLARAATALRRAEDPVVLDAAEAGDLLRGMTDVRLVLAERIGLHSDEDAEALHAHLDLLARRAADGAELTPPEEHWVTMASLYETLTWWQEALVAAVR